MELYSFINKRKWVLENIPYKKVIYKINNQLFDTYAAAARQLKVSKQAVQQSCKRKSKCINNIPIQWL